MMSCAEAARLMSDRMNRPVGRRKLMFLQFHLLICGGCRQYRKQLTLIRHWLRSDRLNTVEHSSQEAVRLDAGARTRILAAIDRDFNEGDTRA